MLGDLPHLNNEIVGPRDVVHCVQVLERNETTRNFIVHLVLSERWQFVVDELVRARLKSIKTIKARVSDEGNVRAARPKHGATEDARKPGYPKADVRAIPQGAPGVPADTSC